jgi:hypothetical protein
MLEHLFLLVEFKPMFEFCLFSFFSKMEKILFSFTPFPVPLHSPARKVRPRPLSSVAQPPSLPQPAAHRVFSA